MRLYIFLITYAKNLKSLDIYKIILLFGKIVNTFR